MIKPRVLSNGMELTPDRVANLRQLAHWHLGPGVCSAMGFDMEMFCTRQARPDDMVNLDVLRVTSDGRVIVDPVSAGACGTAGCLVGHGPLAGLSPLFAGEDWWQYQSRLFFPWESESGEVWLEEAVWCFGSNWHLIDNTPVGGAKRILWYLEYGLPENWCEQLSGVEPLCYADWDPPGVPPAVVEMQVEQCCSAVT